MKIFFQIWCTSLGLAFIWPQVWRAARHDTSHGISPFGLMHGIVGSSLWLTYGILQGDAAIWFSNISFIVAQSIIISVVYRHGKIPRQVLVRVGAALFALALLLTQVSATPVGFVAIAVSGSSIVPQLIHVIRTENLHGISISSYLIAVKPTEPSKVTLEDLSGMYDTLIHRHWMQGSVRALQNNADTAWIADEIYKLWPMTSPRWVS